MTADNTDSVGSGLDYTPTTTSHPSSNDGRTTGTEPKSMPLAIVGMGCRFGGGVTSPSRLWDLVSAGKDVWSEIPKSRFNAKNFYHPNPTKVSAVSISLY